MEKDFAFEMAASNIRYGAGVTRELGMDLEDLGTKRVMLLTDPNLKDKPPVETALESLKKSNVDFVLYDEVGVEPTDSSLKEAVRVATDQKFDAFVAVGGGSVMDTAKAANLYSTYPPDDFLDYVNQPIGKGLPVPGPLKPLFAVPTTAGTGSETTGVVIFDLEEMHAKTGIGHRRLKPTLGLVDPENTRTLSPMIAACTGLDVLTHALESYTAMPFTERPRPERPVLRPAYQGSNPISDLWSLQAIRMGAKYLVRAVEDPEDVEARSMMILASAYAGVGFGNAGCTLPHGMSYPVSGMVRDFRPEGYPGNKPFIPHGMSVVLNAPAAFRFMGPGSPERHLIAAEALGADISDASHEDAGEILAARIMEIMKRLNIPNGLSGVGYTEADVPALVKGALPQHRVTKLSPRPADEQDFHAMFTDALNYW